jgi:hypothetical protein
LSRSVVIVPLPNGRVVLVDPSERRVNVPEPNGCVVPVRGLLGGSIAKTAIGVSSAAKIPRTDPVVRCIVELPQAMKKVRVLPENPL